MLASDYAFGRIVGVEFSPELHEVAVRNLAIYTSPAQRCRVVESVNADATTYEFPPTPLLLYAYNPFDETVMAAILEKLMRSLEAAPREVIFVYYNPRWRVMEKFPALPPRARLDLPYDPTRYPQRPAAIYANFELPRGRGWLRPSRQACRDPHGTASGRVQQVDRGRPARDLGHALQRWHVGQEAVRLGVAARVGRGVQRGSARGGATVPASTNSG